MGFWRLDSVAAPPELGRELEGSVRCAGGGGCGQLEEEAG